MDGTPEEGSAEETPSVVVVDDDADVRAMLAALLTHAGFHVRSAANGGEALDLIRDRPPDVLVTDLQMPGVDGLDLITRARDLEQGASLAAVLYSGMVDDERLRTAEGLEGVVIHAKTGSPRAVTEVVRSLLGRRAQGRPADR